MKTMCEPLAFSREQEQECEQETLFDPRVVLTVMKMRTGHAMLGLW